MQPKISIRHGSFLFTLADAGIGKNKALPSQTMDKATGKLQLIAACILSGKNQGTGQVRHARLVPDISQMRTSPADEF